MPFLAVRIDYCRIRLRSILFCPLNTLSASSRPIQFFPPLPILILPSIHISIVFVNIYIVILLLPEGTPFVKFPQLASQSSNPKPSLKPSLSDLKEKTRKVSPPGTILGRPRACRSLKIYLLIILLKKIPDIQIKMPKLQMRPKKVQEQQQPSEMTVNVRGQKRDYYYVTTVKSMEELDSFRFKNVCMFNGSMCNPRIRNVSKSFIMPCTRKRYGKGCEYELRAVRPDLESGTIHLYAHSQHNHPIMSEERRATIRREKELMPDANPPAIFRTADNLEWQFLRTFAEYEKMQKFRHKNQGHPISTVDKNRMRIRYHCNRRRRAKNHCQFMLLSLKTTTNGYHVYKHGQHNHNNCPALIRKSQTQRNIENDGEEGIEEDNEEREKEEEEVQEDSDECDNADDDEKDPPRNITKNINGHIRKYYFLKTLKSLQELDKFRFENYCHFNQGKPFEILKSLTIPCTRKLFGKTCNFELLALPSVDLQSGEIHVYAHSQHSNHPFMSKEKRASIIREKDLMPHENPTKTFVTPDNIQWQFLETFPSYDKMQNFRHKNNCHSQTKSWREICRVRFYCKLRWVGKCNCQFMLLALKTTKEGYHVYGYGQHNNHHALIKSKISQQPTRGRLEQERMENNEGKDMLLPMEEEDDEEEDMGQQEQMEDDEEEEEKDESNEEKDKDGLMGAEEDDEESENEVESIEEEQQKEDEATEEEEDVPIDQEEGEREPMKEEVGEEEEEEEDEEEELLDEQEEDEQIKQEVKEETMKVEIIEENAKEETLKEKLAKANEKVYKWMAGIGPNEIEETIGDWDKLSLLKMVEMADEEIREHPEKSNIAQFVASLAKMCHPQMFTTNTRIPCSL